MTENCSSSLPLYRRGNKSYNSNVIQSRNVLDMAKPKQMLGIFIKEDSFIFII